MDGRLHRFRAGVRLPRRAPSWHFDVPRLDVPAHPRAGGCRGLAGDVHAAPTRARPPGGWRLIGTTAAALFDADAARPRSSRPAAASASATSGARRPPHACAIRSHRGRRRPPRSRLSPACSRPCRIWVDPAPRRSASPARVPSTAGAPHRQPSRGQRRGRRGDRGRRRRSSGRRRRATSGSRSRARAGPLTSTAARSTRTRRRAGPRATELEIERFEHGRPRLPRRARRHRRPDSRGFAIDRHAGGAGPGAARVPATARRGPEPRAARPAARYRALGARRPTTDRACALAPGPRADWFAASALHLLFEAVWTVSGDADRVGVRLDGPALERPRGGTAERGHGARRAPGAARGSADDAAGRRPGHGWVPGDRGRDGCLARRSGAGPPGHAPAVPSRPADAPAPRRSQRDAVRCAREDSARRRMPRNSGVT